MQPIKRWISFMLMTAAVSLIFVHSQALAKRMGSGANIGMQRSMPAHSTPASKPSTANNPTNTAPSAPTNATAPAAATAAGAATASKASWLAPLAAFAAGGLLAAIFMGGGFEGINAMDILFLLLIIAGAYFFLRRRAHSVQSSQPSYQHRELPATAAISAATNTTTSTTQSVDTRPDWFDESSFLTNAKDWFVRLQAAWDANDRTTLAALTTPALFAQLSAQLDSGERHQTRVDEVNAQLLQITREQDQWLVSVLFTGFIAEEAGAFSHAFREIWHLLREGEADGSWKLAGIQQDAG